MNHYPQPEDVTSPKLHWTLIKVLFKGDPHNPTNHDPEGYSVAVGMWDGHPCLAIRWNANEERPVGNPQSRGLPTWFIVPDDLVNPILSTVEPDVQVYARNILAM